MVAFGCSLAGIMRKLSRSPSCNDTGRRFLRFSRLPSRGRPVTQRTAPDIVDRAYGVDTLALQFEERRVHNGVGMVAPTLGRICPCRRLRRSTQMTIVKRSSELRRMADLTVIHGA